MCLQSTPCFARYSITACVMHFFFLHLCFFCFTTISPRKCSFSASSRLLFLRFFFLTGEGSSAGSVYQVKTAHLMHAWSLVGRDSLYSSLLELSASHLRSCLFPFCFSLSLLPCHYFLLIHCNAKCRALLPHWTVLCSAGFACPRKQSHIRTFTHTHI